MEETLCEKNLIFSYNNDRLDPSFPGCKCFCTRKKTLKSAIFCSNCKNYVHLDCEKISSEDELFFQKYSKNIVYCCTACMKANVNFITKNTTDSLLSDISRSLKTFVKLKKSKSEEKTYATVAKSSETAVFRSTTSFNAEKYAIVQQFKGENCNTNSDLKISLSKSVPGSKIVSCKRLGDNKVLVKCHDNTALNSLVKSTQHNILSYTEYQLQKRDIDCT